MFQRRSTPAPLYGRILASLAGFLLGTLSWNLTHTSPTFFSLSLFSATTRPAQSPATHETHPDPPFPLWTSTSWPSLTTIYAFGDANTATYFAPQADPQPGPGNPLGNALHPSNPTPGGQRRTWLHSLQASHPSFSSGAAQQTRLRIYNLARHNGTIERYTYTTHPAGTLRAAQDVTHALVEESSLNEQVDQFEFLYKPEEVYYYTPPQIKLGSSSSLSSGMREKLHPQSRQVLADWSSDDTLFALWFGLADLQESITAGRAADMAFGPIFASYSASLERLYIAGARRFLLINCAPVGALLSQSGSSSQANSRSQAQDKDEAQETIRHNIQTFNTHLRTLIRKFTRRHADVHIFHFNAHDFLHAALNEPAKYKELDGVTVFDRACLTLDSGAADSHTNKRPGAAERDTDTRPDAAHAKQGECKEYFWLNGGEINSPVQDLLGKRIAADCLGEKTGGWCVLNGGDEGAGGEDDLD